MLREHHRQGEPECLCFIHWHTLMSICRGHCQPVEVMPVANFWNHVCGSFAPVQVGPLRFFWNLHYVSGALGHTRNNMREWSAVLTEDTYGSKLGIDFSFLVLILLVAAPDQKNLSYVIQSAFRDRERERVWNYFASACVASESNVRFLCVQSSFTAWSIHADSLGTSFRSIAYHRGYELSIPDWCHFLCSPCRQDTSNSEKKLGWIGVFYDHVPAELPGPLHGFMHQKRGYKALSCSAWHWPEGHSFKEMPQLRWSLWHVYSWWAQQLDRVWST